MNSARNKKITPTDWERVRELLGVLGHVPRTIRIKFYQEHQVPENISNEAEALLGVQDDVGTFLEKPVLKSVPSSLEFIPGDMVGGFRIVSEVGRGSFAVVYQAEEMALGRRVALKISRGSPEEAKLLASLEHDHIVRVFSERFENEKFLRLVCMQLVSGATVEQVLKHLESLPAEYWNGEGILYSAEHLSTISPVFHTAALRERERIAKNHFVGAFLEMGALMADALSYAHSRGILHLDVKPSNILVTPFGRPMLADFNISIDADRLAQELPEQFGGTLQYMSPEQKRVFDDPDNAAVRQAVDARSDIYSLGVVLQEILAFAQSRKLPFSDAPEISWALARATAPSPNDRFGSAVEMAGVLRGCLDVLTLKRSLPPLAFVTRYADKHPVIALTAIGAAPQLTASLVGILYNKVRIISQLSGEQMRIFDLLNSVYNPVIYTVVGVIWVAAVLRAAKKLDRKRIRRLPELGFLLTSLSWLPSAAIFAIFLHRAGDGLHPVVMGHLILSFVMSWMIAASYSYLFHVWIVLRNLYTHAWVGEQNIGRAAFHELRHFGKRLKMCLRWVILIPLVGAALLLGLGNQRLTPAEFDSFRYLGLLFVSLSACGVYVAADLGAQLQKILAAFEKLNRT